MDYFTFFNIPVAFLIDEAALRTAFYKNSKKYHPDFYTLEDEDKQQEVLELSTLNNNAYKTLSDFHLRMRYILQAKGILEEEVKSKIDQFFLMEMMEINEKLMELEFDFDQNQYKAIKGALKKKETELYKTIDPILQNYNDKEEKKDQLFQVKDYYLKHRYLLRISENLAKFASR
ncbi:MAG: Fe-S protein assembly co-chaperone HscB [Bacteroidetes bacterium]|nr:Fe-S protein assembly co-chaperone HscB [Bacteroidota bacterium]